MPCPNIFDRICDELGENIESVLCQDLRDHVDNCEDCRCCLQSIRETVHLYRRMPDVQVPNDVTVRLFKMLDESC
ncbi:MAG: hypothetical protein H6696_17835 [Deferribacteres bacterium]|nr:hypothetical protein [candidate division KSB1 bacterium]MCB9503796.1 hypothetical protein [Deferribacteres bacterium]